MRILSFLPALALLAPLTALAPAASDVDYEADVEFALDELKQQCGGFFRLKEIDWKKVSKEFSKAAKDVDSPEEHRVLLQRLLARLKDGHCEVRPTAAAGDVGWPEGFWQEQAGAGFFLCQVGKKFYVKRAWSVAADVGLEAGSEVIKIDSLAAKKWVEEREAELADRFSYSTPQHLRFSALHHGITAESGGRMKLEVKTPEGKKKKKTISIGRTKQFIEGAVYFPEGVKWAGESVRYGRTEKGNAYVQVRRVRSEVLDELDEALAAVADAPGLILDFRGNTGGGCNHDALEGRFVPAGHKMQRLAGGPIGSHGDHPYGGPMVVIVDGTVVSAGETTSGMFKEDGRAYMIGESPTAGMSSQKTTIELPSGLFELYVSTRSNRQSFNQGRGIEGIGVAPHERLEYDPKELAAGVDTMIRRAEELLADYPQDELEYDPADFGWGR
ncbi:MAG: S41 family peptidase [Planctomycetota bacterium]